MTARSRKERGRATERIVAQYLAEHGWPYAEPVGAGRPGSDITGTPGIDWEVKARRGFEPKAAMRQQAERAKDGIVPVAVLRMDGDGPASIGDWPAVLPLSVLVSLLHDAAYGTRPETPTTPTQGGRQ
jgi:hypothetical protein